MTETSTIQPTHANRVSDTETRVERRFDAPVERVFEAWSKPQLFRQWWLPSSFGMTMVSCDMDVRTGGTYRLEIGHPSSDSPMAFHGRYLEVVPNEKIVWTNEEGGEGGQVTTVTFAPDGEGTRLTVSDKFPSKEALDAEIGSGAMEGMPEQLKQLEAFLS
jgi:uncharacterized protein YndB with AHSA1/START domain